MKSNSNKLNKSGYIQIDLMFAGILFLTLLTLIYTSQTDYFEKLYLSQETLKLKSTAKDLCKTLSQTQGIPSNWQTDLTSLNSIGLLNTSHKLDSSKLTPLQNINYIQIKQQLHLKKYNFHINITNLNSRTELLNFGFKSKSNSLSYSYSCYIPNDNLNQIQLEVWK